MAYELNGKSHVWGLDSHILADAANSLRWLVWAKTKDGQKNRNRPQMIRPPAPAKKKQPSFGIDELNRVLKRKRI